MFPTLVSENVLPEHIRLSALADFPGQSWKHWHRYDNGKLASKHDLNIPASCLLALQSLAQRVLPPAGSFWDLSYHGSGMHFMPSGTHLGAHVDAEFHPTKPWSRVASLVYFLETTKGGELQIENDVYHPVMGRCVMFKANMRHQVRITHSHRRTLALFAWKLDSSKKTTTQAKFES